MLKKFIVFFSADNIPQMSQKLCSFYRDDICPYTIMAKTVATETGAVEQTLMIYLEITINNLSHPQVYRGTH